MIEMWKDVIGYEGLYQVSNLGRVKSLSFVSKDGKRIKGKIKKQCETSKRGRKTRLSLH